MAEQTNYRIKLRKDSVEIEVQGDKTWVEAKFAELKPELLKTVEVKTPIGPISPPIPPTPPPFELPDSIGEFFVVKGSPKSHTDRAIAFSYWLTKKLSMESYNTDDIDKCFAEALIAKPANTSDVMNANQKKAYLIQTPGKDGKKAWRISRPGEEYVEKMTS